jgi:hypothetical protein
MDMALSMFWMNSYESAMERSTPCSDILKYSDIRDISILHARTHATRSGTHAVASTRNQKAQAIDSSFHFQTDPDYDSWNWRV